MFVIPFIYAHLIKHHNAYNIKYFSIFQFMSLFFGKLHSHSYIWTDHKVLVHCSAFPVDIWKYLRLFTKSMNVLCWFNAVEIRKKNIFLVSISWRISVFSSHYIPISLYSLAARAVCLCTTPNQFFFCTIKHFRACL